MTAAREKLLIERILDDLGDDFGPEAFNEALKLARAAEQKPDLVYEMDEEIG